MLYFPFAFLLVFGALLFGLRRLRRERPQISVEDVESLVELHEWEQASAALKDLAKSKWSDPKIPLLEAKVLRGTGDLQKALSCLNRALELFPDDLSLISEKARVLHLLKDAKSVINLLKPRLDSFQSEEDILEMASILYRSGVPDDAWNLLESSIPSSSRGQLLALAADCQFALQNYSGALVLYMRGIDSGWNNRQVLLRLGSCYAQTEQWEVAKETYQKIFEKDKEDVCAILGYGHCLQSEGKLREALLLFQRDSVWSKGSPLVMAEAGICAARLGSFEFARRYLEAAYATGLRQPKMLAFLGYTYEQLRAWGMAERIYLELVRAFRSHEAGYVGLSWLYGVGLTVRLSQAQGLQMARRAVEMRPESSTWEMLSACEARAGNFKRAHEIQEKLVVQTQDQTIKLRRRQAMRTLRKGRPLDETQVSRIAVA